MFWKRSTCCWHGVHFRKSLPVSRRVRLPFCILKVLGDVLDDGELLFEERAKTVDGARRRIQALAAVRPGQYVIYNVETGERVSIFAGAESARQAALRVADVHLTGRFA